SLTPYTHLKLL
ncbi:unnamed protein product, partial [Callosobruchus maculatus]